MGRGWGRTCWGDGGRQASFAPNQMVISLMRGARGPASLGRICVIERSDGVRRRASDAKGGTPVDLLEDG